MAANQSLCISRLLCLRSPLEQLRADASTPAQTLPQIAKAQEPSPSLQALAALKTMHRPQRASDDVVLSFRGSTQRSALSHLAGAQRRQTSSRPQTCAAGLASREAQTAIAASSGVQMPHRQAIYDPPATRVWLSADGSRSIVPIRAGRDSPRKADLRRNRQFVQQAQDLEVGFLQFQYVRLNATLLPTPRRRSHVCSAYPLPPPPCTCSAHGTADRWCVALIGGGVGALAINRLNPS